MPKELVQMKSYSIKQPYQQFKEEGEELRAYQQFKAKSQAGTFMRPEGAFIPNL